MNAADTEGITGIDTNCIPLPPTNEDVDDMNSFENEIQHPNQPPYLEQIAYFDSFENLNFSFSVSQSSSGILDLINTYFMTMRGRKLI